MRRIPKEVLKHYELCKRIIELEGPLSLRQIKGFHDEALKRECNDFWSSRLTSQWRVIYKVEKHECLVYVFDISPYNYKRR